MDAVVNEQVEPSADENVDNDVPEGDTDDAKVSEVPEVDEAEREAEHILQVLGNMPDDVKKASMHRMVRRMMTLSERNRALELSQGAAAASDNMKKLFGIEIPSDHLSQFLKDQPTISGSATDYVNAFIQHAATYKKPVEESAITDAVVPVPAPESAAAAVPAAKRRRVAPPPNGTSATLGAKDLDKLKKSQAQKVVKNAPNAPYSAALREILGIGDESDSLF